MLVILLMARVWDAKYSHLLDAHLISPIVTERYKELGVGAAKPSRWKLEKVDVIDMSAVVDLALCVCDYHQAEALLRDPSKEPGSHPTLTVKGVLEELGRGGAVKFAARPRLMQWLMGVIRLIMDALHFMFGKDWKNAGGKHVGGMSYAVRAEHKKKGHSMAVDDIVKHLFRGDLGGRSLCLPLRRTPGSSVQGLRCRV